MKGKTIYLTKNEVCYLFEIMASEEMGGNEIASKIKDKL